MVDVAQKEDLAGGVGGVSWLLQAAKGPVSRIEAGRMGNCRVRVIEEDSVPLDVAGFTRWKWPSRRQMCRFRFEDARMIT